MFRRSSSTTVSDRPEPTSQQEVVGTSNPSTIPVQDILIPTIASVDLALNALDVAIFLDNPVDSQALRINESAFHRICSIHGVPFDDVLVPSGQDRPHLPPVGYTACNKFMFWVDSVPSFNSSSVTCYSILRSLHHSYIQTVMRSYTARALSS